MFCNCEIGKGFHNIGINYSFFMSLTYNIFEKRGIFMEDIFIQ